MGREVFRKFRLGRAQKSLGTADIYERPIEGHGNMQTCKKQSLMLKQNDLFYEKHPEFMAFPNGLLKNILKGKRTWKTSAWQKDGF